MNNKLPDDELISAFLDGELTADEQAMVERAIGEDTQVRQLYDDLRALRSRLQALSRREPITDFTDQILRRAERAMLAEPDVDDQPETTDAPFVDQTAPDAVVGSNPWRVVAAVAALAAATAATTRQGFEPPETPTTASGAVWSTKGASVVSG